MKFFNWSDTKPVAPLTPKFQNSVHEGNFIDFM